MADEKRYCTIEESIIESCKEINLMRKGLLPKPSGNWRDWIEGLREKYKDDLEEKEVITPIKKKVALR
ncbi:MAG: hypothetical protein IKT98_00855 [Selenomonadaceae bacterium]|nr:hypothetical protein [Selenomonadaceae bacterium]